jgi:hypothetical protein
MSTYIPGNKHDGEVRSEKLEIPVLFCHGKADDMVPYERGEKAAKTISNFVREHRLVKFKIISLILFYSKAWKFQLFYSI